MCLELGRESGAAGEQRDGKEATGSPEHWMEWEEQARPRSETDRSPGWVYKCDQSPGSQRELARRLGGINAEGVLEKASGVRK